MHEVCTEFGLACRTLDMARSDAREDVQSEDEFVLLDLALHNACRNVLLAPSPDLEALIYKLELFREQQMHLARSDRVAEIFDGLITDARRLNLPAA